MQILRELRALDVSCLALGMLFAFISAERRTIEIFNYSTVQLRSHFVSVD